jgi:hypothetical protein
MADKMGSKEKIGNQGGEKGEGLRPSNIETGETGDVCERLAQVCGS